MDELLWFEGLTWQTPLHKIGWVWIGLSWLAVWGIWKTVKLARDSK